MTFKKFQTLLEDTMRLTLLLSCHKRTDEIPLNNFANQMGTTKCQFCIWYEKCQAVTMKRFHQCHLESHSTYYFDYVYLYCKIYNIIYIFYETLDSHFGHIYCSKTFSFLVKTFAFGRKFLILKIG